MFLGRVGELLRPGVNGIAWRRILSCETKGSRKLCIVRCHNCQIYGTWTEQVGKRAF